ncbi:MAG: hypothetical protein E5X59_41305, partial [Mesorhizobium sp.]
GRGGGVADGVPDMTPPRSASRMDVPGRATGLARPSDPLKGEGSAAGALLIHAWPDRVAKARGERGRFVLANGSGAMLEAA